MSKPIFTLLVLLVFSFYSANCQNNVTMPDKPVNIQGVAIDLPKYEPATPDTKSNPSEVKQQSGQSFDEMIRSIKTEPHSGGFIPGSSIPTNAKTATVFPGRYEAMQAQYEVDEQNRRLKIFLICLSILVIISILFYFRKVLAVKYSLLANSMENRSLGIEDSYKVNSSPVYRDYPVDIILQLERLQSLREKKTISEEEFLVLKQKLINLVIQ